MIICIPKKHWVNQTRTPQVPQKRREIRVIKRKRVNVDRTLLADAQAQHEVQT